MIKHATLKDDCFINSDLCDSCGEPGQIVSTWCVCGDWHGFCNPCWGNDWVIPNA